MKIRNCLSGYLFLIALATASAGVVQPLPNPLPNPTEPSALVKFDLDFPGGTPKELIAAIQKASGRALNAIVPEEFADTKLPALKMKNVDVEQLFQALSAASHKLEAISVPSGGFTSQTTSFGFRSQGGKVSDDTIWNFYVDKPTFPPPLKVVRFYSLAPYLELSTTVDDITTAIKTGAQMLGEGTGPALSFHKDTKLLIAVGEQSKLEIIDSVLRALDSQIPRPSPRIEQPKNEKK